MTRAFTLKILIASYLLFKDKITITLEQEKQGANSRKVKDPRCDRRLSPEGANPK